MGTEKGAREEGERRGRRNIQAGETSCPSPAFTGPSNLLLAPETSSQLWLRQSFPPPLVSPSLSFLQGQAPRTAHLLEGSQVPLRLRPPRSPSPGGRRCPAFPPQAQGKGWVPQSLHFPTSHFPEPSFPPPQILPVGVWAISSDGAHSQPWQKMLSEMENLQDAWVRTRI